MSTYESASSGESAAAEANFASVKGVKAGSVCPAVAIVGEPATSSVAEKRSKRAQHLGKVITIKMMSFIQDFAKKANDAISIGLEELFYRLGLKVATHPKKVILLSFLCTLVCSMGLFYFYEQKDMVKLWIPADNDFAINHLWLKDNFPPKLRYQSMVLVHEENILNPDVIRYMYNVHKKVQKIKTQEGRGWQDYCFRLPVVQVPKILRKRRKRNSDDFFSEFDDWGTNNFETEMDESFADIFNNQDNIGKSADPSVLYYPEPYCDTLEKMKTACFETSLLELFGVPGDYNETLIESLTQDQLIEAINTVNISGVFLSERNFTKFLGEIERNTTGHIIGAKATYINWFSEANVTAKDSARESLGLDDNVDDETLRFELELRTILENDCDLPKGLNAYGNVHRSFGDVSTQTIYKDVGKMVIGFTLLYMYVQIMMGRLNQVEQRGILGSTAILNVLLAILSAFGLCFFMGLEFGPMHTLIGCILVGLGVDNSFVIVQEFENYQSIYKEKGIKISLEKRIAKGLSHAGVAITVTSMTDVMVFAIGGTTVLPSLASYSLFAAMGILFTYFYQITFFVACLALDTKRIDERRDGLIWCKKYSADWKPNSCSQRNHLQDVFGALGSGLKSKPIKAMVLMSTIAYTSLAIYGNIQIQISFDFLKFLPEDSSLYQWHHHNHQYFPEEGFRGQIYFAEADLKMQLMHYRNLSKAVDKSMDKYLVEFDSWYFAFEKYLLEYFVNSDKELFNMSEEFFNEKLARFLYSPSGGKFRHLFEFDGDVKCGLPAPKVLMNSMMFQHKNVIATNDKIEAMTWLKNVIARENFTGKAFAMSPAYSRWEIDEVIGWELHRNLLLAIVCVLIATFVLIADIRSCFLVFLFVILNLVNVVGFMHFWGLTIDIVAATNVIISVGLCVDFSAHIAHSFLHQKKGSKEERMRSTLVSIGPAVLNGGISTLIGIIMLITSESHVFISYFKIFFLMILFGLYHGLIVLPVLLSLIGPDPYAAKTEDADVENENAEELSEIKVKLTDDINSPS